MEQRVQQVRERVSYYWPTYGPPVLGILLVLVALFIGYRILSNRDDNKPTLEDNNLDLTIESTPTPGTTEPMAGVTLPAGTASPAPVAAGSADITKGGVSQDVSTTSATTKGGELPKTGFPLVFAIPAFGALAVGGAKLLRIKRS